MNENAMTGRARVREADTEADTAAAAPDRRTRGAVMLSAVPGSVRALAARLGASRTSVSDWRSGRTLPSEELRAMLESVCGIPLRAWDERDAAPAKAPADGESVPFDLGASSFRVLCDRLQLIESQGAEATTAEVVNVSKEIRAHEDGALKRETGQRAFEERVERALLSPTRQPFYQRVVNMVVDALKPYPDALRDVLAALDAAAEEGDA